MQIKTDADYIFFASSSGHCSLDCQYCIIDPIVKHQPTLNWDDFAYLFEQINYKKAGFIFSGTGDFFAGYKKQEKLLQRLLEQDVDIGLDINGVMIHEFAELTAEQLAKILHINLTLHYQQLINKNALSVWEKNALLLIEKKGKDNFVLGTILSPLESALWEDTLAFFEKAIFTKTQQKIVLIRDVRLPFEAIDEARLQTLQQKFAHLIDETREEDFAAPFQGHDTVLCPAGHKYFRLWHDGKVQGCPYIRELMECGNLKTRHFQPKTAYFQCHQPKECDCYVIAQLGKMQYVS